MDRKYEDMLYLPHHVSARRAPMSAHDRAAQFSPFAALRGFEAAVAETAQRQELAIREEERQMSRQDGD